MSTNQTVETQKEFERQKALIEKFQGLYSNWEAEIQNAEYLYDSIQKTGGDYLLKPELFQAEVDKIEAAFEQLKRRCEAQDSQRSTMTQQSTDAKIKEVKERLDKISRDVKDIIDSSSMKDIAELKQILTQCEKRISNSQESSK